MPARKYGPKRINRFNGKFAAAVCKYICKKERGHHL